MTALVTAGNLGTDFDMGAQVAGKINLAVTPQLKTLHTATGGGTIALDGSGNLSWSTRFIVGMGGGNGAVYATDGYFSISQPASGTVITGVGGASNVTVTAAGISMSGYTTLYYILPLGSSNGTVSTNFRVASYSAALVVPANWIPVATFNPEQGGTLTVLGRYALTAGDSIDTTAVRPGLTAPTRPTTDNSTKIATTAYTQQATQSLFVASIAALRALPYTVLAAISSTFTVEVASYYANGISGGGLFVWNSGSTARDDGGLAINPTGNSGAGRWLRQIGHGFVSISMFGTKGDMSQDESPYAANAFLSGLEVIIPAGTYYHTKPFFIPGVGQRIRGAGRSATQFVTDPNINSTLSVTGSTTSGSATVSVSSPLYLSTSQPISGSGIPAGATITAVNAAASTITLSATATATAAGVALTAMPVGAFVIGNAAELRDFFVTMSQSSASSLNTYNVPNIYAQTGNRFKLENFGISGGMVGIDMQGNQGGAYIKDLQLTAMTTGIKIDGCEDTVRIEDLHWYPFNLGSFALAKFLSSQSNGGPTCLSVGRCDDLIVRSSLFIGGLAIYTFMGNRGGGMAGGCFGSVSDCDFDTFCGINNQGGTLSLSSCCLTLGDASSFLINASAGFTHLGDPIIEFGVKPNGAPIVVAGGGSNPVVSVSGGQLNYLAVFDFTAVVVGQTTGNTVGTFDMVNTYIQRPTNSASLSNPIIRKYGGNARMTAIGNRVSDFGSGSGTFMYIDTDTFDRVIGNVSPGWTNSFPTASAGVYSSN